MDESDDTLETEELEENEGFDEEESDSDVGVEDEEVLDSELEYEIEFEE